MHYHPIHAPRFLPEVQLSAVRLSAAEEAGQVAITYGLRGERHHQPPRSRPSSQSVLFIWPAPSQHHPHVRPTA